MGEDQEVGHRERVAEARDLRQLTAPACSLECTEMRHLTIRHTPPLGVNRKGPKRNGLAQLAGTWTAEEHASFEAALAVTEQIDEELWLPDPSRASR